MKEILVATDASIGADRALDQAADLAGALGGRLVIVHVSGGIPPDLFRSITNTQNNWLRETEASVSAEILRNAQIRVHGRFKPEVLLESRDGDPAREIMALAEERGVGMIVVGKRGAGRLGGLLLGSVSQKLVSLSPRPVLVVP